MTMGMLHYSFFMTFLVPAASQVAGAAYYEDTGIEPPRDTSGSRSNKLQAQRTVDELPLSYWPSVGCERFFVDLGGNRGDTIDRWYQGYFARLFEKSSSRIAAVNVPPNSYCVMSFEGNPRWTSSLREARQRQAQLGHHIDVFPETIVHTGYSPKTLYVDGLASNSISSSIYASKRIGLETKRDKQKLLHVKGNREALKSKVTVKSVSFSHLISHLKSRVKKDIGLVVKMDIEGAEYDVISDALISGTFCFIDILFIEWHEDVKSELNVPANFEGVIQSIAESPTCNMTVVLAD